MDPMSLSGLQPMSPVGFGGAMAPAMPMGGGGMAAIRAAAGLPPAADYEAVMGDFARREAMISQFTNTMLLLVMNLMLGQAVKTLKGLAGGGGGGLGSPGGGGGASAAGGSSDAGSVSGSTAPLSGDDAALAGKIDKYLQSKGSPAAGRNFGELAVKYGREYQVDPLILLAIAGLETQYGKLGVGVNGLLGVGAYDSDPNNSTRNPKFSGVENQLRVGAETFARLRKKGGSGPNDPVEKQIQAVGRAGWATDPGWASKVISVYKSIRGTLG